MTQIKWTVPTGGDFANGANWNSGTVPGPNDDALLTTTGTYTVVSTANETVNSLQMISTVTFDINGGTFQMTNGSGSGTDNGLIQINGNNTLVLGGTLAGSGTLQLNTNGYNADLILNTATTTLSGGGKIVLSDAGANRIFAGTPGGVLNNVSDTISGAGQIGLDQTGLNNQVGGTIDATGTGTTMVLDFGTFSALNAGLIEATGIAGLQIQNSTITNTGTIKAVGANVNVNLLNATIIGGTLADSGGGTIETNGGNTAGLNGVTIAAGSVVAINNNSTLDISNTITNKGTITLNTDGYTNELVATSSVTTLTGGGMIVMSDTAANYIFGGTASTKLVNVNNTISGSGQLGSGQLVLDNQAAGVINSNGTYGLTINATGFTNEGLIEDTGTGGIGINATTIVNKGTILSTGTGSTVNLYNNTSIVGGKLVTSHAGVIETTSGNQAKLDGSTSTGAVTITAGSLLQINNNSTLSVAGSIINAGTIQLNTDGYTNELAIASPKVTLSGGGHLTLSDAGANYILGTAATNTLVNVNDTISGSGNLGNGSLALDNQAAGVINATGTVAGLTINTTAFTNEGLVEDTGPAGLGLNASVLVNNATLAAIGANATFNFYNGAVIEGGTLVTSGGGVFLTSNTGTLDGTANGALTLTAGSTAEIVGNNTLDLVGSIVNDGTIFMGANGYDNDLVVNSATVTLTGGGQVLMNDVGSNRIYGAMAANLLVNVNNTISGSGQIGVGQGSFDNQAAGIIDATGTNAGLTIAATSFTNEGLIEDTGPAGLGIQGTTIVNTGTIAAIGTNATTNIYNSSVIEGGTLFSSNGGVLETTNTGTLDGATHGAITLASGSIFDINGSNTLDLVGSIVNHGTVALNTNGYNNDLVFNSATVTLSGGGTIALNDVGSNRIYGAASTNLLVNVNNTIIGSGQIGVLQGSFDNQAAGVIDASGTSAGLTLAATAFSNEGLVEDTGPAGLTISNTVFVNNGTIAAVGAGSTVNVVNGSTIEGGVLTSSNGGYFETTNTGTLDGTTNGALTIAAGSLFEITPSNTLDLVGSIVNHGTISMDSNGYNNDLIIASPVVTLSGGGTVRLNDVGSNRIYGAVATDMLVNAADTISGSGQLGVGQLTLDNQKAGVINATGTSTNLNINLGSTFTNEGLVEATGPAGLLIQNATLTNTGTIASMSGSTVNITTSTTVTNFNAGTLTGGTWEAISAGGTNTSTLLLPNGPITVDAAHLVISGAGAAIVAGGTSIATSVTSITAAGELDIQNGATFTATNALTDSGKILLAGSLVAPALTTTPGGSITATGTASITTTAKLVNNGTLAAASGGRLSLAGGTLSSTGTVMASAGGSISVTAAERNNNLVAGKLSNGTWIASGSGASLLLASATVTNDAAIITLSGAGSSFKSGGAAKTLESTLNTVSAAAQLNILNTRGFASTAVGGITDAGTIALGGATFSDVGLTIAAGGSFIGGGTLAGAVSDNGALIASASPAGSTGTLTVTGAIGGTGLLSVSGGAALNAAAGFSVGTLSVGAGTLNGAGTVSGASTVGGTLALGAGGTLTTGSLTVQPGGMVAGASVRASGTILDNGTITLTGGTLSASTLTLGSAASRLAGSGTVSPLVASSGTIDASGGTLTLAAGEQGGVLAVEAAATLAGGTVAANGLTIAAGGNFIGTGSVGNTTTDNGTLAASAGTLTLAAIAGTGSALIGSGATFVSTSALTISGGVTFAAGGNSVLALGRDLGNTTVISGFASGTTIDVLGQAITGIGYQPANGKLALKEGSVVVGNLLFAGTYSYGNFALSSDGHGGTDIVYATVPAASVADLHRAVSGVAVTPQTAGIIGVAPAGVDLAPAPASIGGNPAVAVHDTVEVGLLHGSFVA